MSKKLFNEQQKIALKTISKNVLLSAGAGSGKTEVLSSRFLQIIEDDVNASNILAITFTIKAAAEMRGRIARNIQELIDEKGKLVDGFGWEFLNSKHDLEYWNKQLVDLQSAQISTIHSLCARMLMENPVEARLAPGSKVLEEEDSLAFDDDCLSGFVRDSIASQNKNVLYLLENYTLFSFQEQLKGFSKYRNAILNFGGDRKDALTKLKSFFDVAPKYQIDCFIETASEFIKTANAELFVSNKGSKPNGSTKNNIANLVSALTSYIADKSSCYEISADVESALAAMSDKTAFSELNSFVKNLRKYYAYIGAYCRREEAKTLLEYWYRTLEDFDSYREAKRAELSILSFDDLEEKAIELLENNPAVRRKYQEMFTFIMVDEFQDTNDKQKQLIYLLYGNSKDKLDKPLDMPKKNLFVVGDPKQSIYRFRGADVKVFHQVTKDIKNGNKHNPGVIIKMNTNYRSHTNIIDACNILFPSLMGEDENKPVYYEPLEKGLKEQGVQVEVMSAIPPQYGSGENGKVTEDDERNEEVKCIVAKIMALKDEGVEYKDMTILLRAMTKVKSLTDAFQEVQIPCIVSGGKGFYKRPEIQDLVCVIKACKSKYNLLELVIALKSPFFAEDGYIQEDVITELALEGNLWDALQNYKGEVEALKKAAQKLKRISYNMQVLGLAELWHYLWHELEIEKVLLQLKDSDYRLANANKLYAEAIQFANSTNGNLSQWIEYIDRLAADDRIKDKCADVLAENAVTIMTIHGSKGLQFPYTFVPMLDRKDGGKAPEVMFSEKSGLGFKLPKGNFSTEKSLVYLYLQDEDVVLEDEERARLLYVAMTRAGRRLFLSGVSKDVIDDGNDSFTHLPWINQVGYGLANQECCEHKDSISQLQKVYEEFKSNAKKVAQNIFDFFFGKRKGKVKTEAPEQEELVNQSLAVEEVAETSAVPTVPKKVSIHLCEPLDNFAATGHISYTPSALQCYKRCQKQFYYQYVMNMPGEYELSFVNVGEEGGEVKEQEPKLHEYRGELNAPVFGNLLHRTLELFANCGCDVAKLESCFDQSRADNDVEAETDIGKALEMLQKYIESPLYAPIKEAAQHGRCISEMKFAYYVNDSFRLTGIIDCLYFDGDGKLHIVDFKTGHYHDEHDGYGMQLALYKLVAKELYGVEVVSTELHYLPDLKPWKLEAKTTDYLAMATQIADKVYYADESGEAFEINKASCHNCKFKWLCNNK